MLKFIINVVPVIFLSLSLGVVNASPVEELYDSNCAMCHGDDGMAVLPGTPHFATNERLTKSNSQLLKSIKEGLNVMPPWAGILEEQEMKDLVTYIRLFPKGQVAVNDLR